MSQLAYYMGRQCLVASWSIAIILASFFAFCIPAQGAETNHKPELAEREAFIRKAMDEQRERVSERLFNWQNKQKPGFRIGLLMKVAMLVPFADWDFYCVTMGNISWEPNAGQKHKKVIVPEGFVSDLASIPRAFWQMLRPEGRYAYAAVVHDYLY